MGPDKHYTEEAPVHRVTVDGFWMNRTPVTNRRLREFVEAIVADAEGWTVVDMKNDWKCVFAIRRKMKRQMAMKTS